MSFHKIKTKSFCAVGRHKSAMKNIYGNITSKGSKVLIGFCSICNREQFMTVGDSTIRRKGLGEFFKNLGKLSSKAGKKIATIVLTNPGRASDITANIATAAASRNFKADLASLLEVINFYHTGKGLYCGESV